MAKAASSKLAVLGTETREPAPLVVVVPDDVVALPPELLLLLLVPGMTVVALEDADW